MRRLLPPGSVLEIGCGQGAMGTLIARDHEYVGVEPDAESFAVARARLGDRVMCATDADVGGRFDVVCAFEVLEHLEDDRAAVERWRDHGRSLLVSVPAHQRLFGATDRRVGHYRRYDPETLRELLSDFKHVEIHSYAFPVGYPLLWVGRMLAGESASREQGTASSGRWLQPKTRARTLAAAPLALIQRPFEHTSLGTGLVALAR